MPKLSLPEIRALLDEAKAAYKAKFTPGFLHSSASNKIAEFDPSKSSKPKELITPGITFASPMENAKWSADNFLPVSGPRSAIEGYKTGATMYPLSINMGKHFDANTPEGQEVVANYVKQKFLSGDEPDKKAAAKFLMGVSDPQYNWKTMESPEFIQHLKDAGHDTFSVNEMGVKNVGVFNPANIRGKFAEYNPDEAMNPDFMKAQGGSIQAHAPGASRGIAPYGFRHVENTDEVSLPKGSGWMGMLPNETGQVSTELSASNDNMSYPMLSPNMSRQDIDSLLANQKPTDEMYSKAEQWAKHRQSQGKSPFISPVGELRYPLPQYAAGGEVLKKVLKFAEDVPFIHYSNHPALNRLEPSMYGQGIKGQEAARLKDAPDIKDRSYFYVNKGEQTMPPEQGLGSQKYQGTASNVYNAAEDPEGFHAIAKSRALDPYMMSFGREMVDPAVKATELERLIKGAGYEGYHTGDVGLMFHPTPVSKID